MIPLPPRTTRSSTLFPYTTPFRSDDRLFVYYTPLGIVADLDRFGLGALAVRLEAREIAAGVLLVVIGDELVAHRLKFADEQAEGGAMLGDRAVAVYADHLPALAQCGAKPPQRWEEHTFELQSPIRNSYAVS